MARIEKISLNSARASEGYSASPETVVSAAKNAVEKLPRWELVGESERGLYAVHETSFFRFRDDVRVSILPTGDGSRIQCESRSRLGRYDFGQNRRNLGELLAEIGRGLG